MIKMDQYLLLTMPSNMRNQQQYNQQQYGNQYNQQQYGNQYKQKYGKKK
jgi:hypothetical protein